MSKNGGGVQTLVSSAASIHVRFDERDKFHKQVTSTDYVPGQPVVFETDEDLLIVFDEPSKFGMDCILLRKGQTAIQPKLLTESTGWQVLRMSAAIRGDPPKI
jgi:hypothetical protein